ncbi:MAG: cell division protein FtsZ [Deltaproteobacteria bacterium]|nr:cell division protein FtsZ [Deltaproteobacteria bacterium]
MSFSIEFAEDNLSYDARIKVIGVGGSGGNAVNTMINLGLEGVEFVVVNTDAQALNNCLAPTKVQIGSTITRGLGAGADPERGRKAAIEDVTRIKEVLTGADMVFITAGMGGGTGTGAAPVIAQLAREDEVLAVGVATKPFLFEGKQRARRAELGLEMLRDEVDTLVTIPNEKLLSLDEEDLSFIEAFHKADEVLYQAVKGISDLITQSGMVNVDFADVRTVMANMGRALMGTGCAKGDGRARLAAELAVSSPLLDDISVDGATGVLINVVGGPDMRMREVRDAATLIQEQAHEDANIIFGATIDETVGDTIKVTVIATGFDQNEIEVIEEVEAVAEAPMEEQVEMERVREVARRSSVSRPQRKAQPVVQTQRAPVAARAARPERFDSLDDVPASSRRRFREEQPVQSQSGRERDRSFLVSRDDIDWDTPAYQRRGS